MPSPVLTPPPPDFSIVISPRERRGFDVSTTPYHAPIEETVTDVLRRRVAIRTDCMTIITAPTNGSKPWIDQPVGPDEVRFGLLVLAQVGASELAHANRIVEGYRYDAVADAILGTMIGRNVPIRAARTIEIDDGPVPQLRTATYHWWSDVQHVVVARPGATSIRIRGIPRGDHFSAWGNARILSRFKRHLATALARSR